MADNYLKRLVPEARPTPRNLLAGYAADLIGAANDYAQKPDNTMPMGKANPLLSLLAEFAGLPSLATTANRISYGEPLTNIGKANVPLLKPETADALMMAPLNPRAALGLASMGLGGMGAEKAIFGGILAKTADKAALARAEKLAASGADPRQIWKDTGWMKGGDGKWRFEIDDSAAQFSGLPKRPTPVSDSLNHAPLTASYPEEMQLPAMYSSTLGRGVQGQYGTFHGERGILGSIDADKSTMLHELQHAIQNREGFARGGSPEGMKSLLSERADLKAKFDQALEQFKTTTDPIAKGNALQEMSHYGVRLGRLPKFDGADDAYRRLAGEAEARAVQKRLNLTPQQRREVFPLDSYDVPIESLIYRN